MLILKQLLFCVLVAIFSGCVFIVNIAKAFSIEEIIESASLILVRNDLLFSICILSALVFMVSYGFFFWPHREECAAAEKSRENIKVYKKNVNLFLNSFIELFQGKEPLFNEIGEACKKGNFSEKQLEDFQFFYKLIGQVLDDFCKGNITRLNKFCLNENDISFLSSIEFEWLCTLINLLGTRALGWNFKQLQSTIDAVYKFDERFFEKKLCEKIHNLAPLLQDWEPINLGDYKFNSQVPGILDYMLELHLISHLR